MSEIPDYTPTCSQCGRWHAEARRMERERNDAQEELRQEQEERMRAAAGWERALREHDEALVLLRECHRWFREYQSMHPSDRMAERIARLAAVLKEGRDG